MAYINVLDDNTINKIAAGEVVERPVSVVKELVENAIDSGASNISVEIKDGGISMIRVTDNGSGINKNDIRTAFLRHATSKITCIEDLLNVSSLGFRGEALSSIAAVAQVELLTKIEKDSVGYRYCIHGGREMSLDEVGVPNGTTIIVRNLFFNTPARLKFLKSPMTEANYISDLMERLVLSHPEVGFKYIINGKDRIVSVGSNDVKQNIYSLYGRDVSNNILQVGYESDEFSISGYIGKPETARGNRGFELFFVNNRCVKSKILSKAVEEAYKSFLMMHKYPFAVIYITVDSKDIDVNVHPAKTEIKFYNEQLIYNKLIEVIYNALIKRELIPEVSNETTDRSITPSMRITGERTVTSPEPFETQKLEEFKASITENLHDKCSMHMEVSLPGVRKVSEEDPDDNNETPVMDDSSDIPIDYVQENFVSQGFLSEESVKEHKIIGQVFNTYWIVEFDEKMFIIDQHAAHEKVIYERLKKQIDSGAIFSQSISPAIIVTLTNAETDTLNKYMHNFEKLGFVIEHFGGREYAICAVPAELFGLSSIDYFHSVLDDLATISRVSDAEEINDRIATMACKAAIKGNMSFTVTEARALIDELLRLDNPYNCPHGRPTIVAYSKYEIEKLFKRIV